MNQGRGPAMMQMPMQPGMPGGPPGMGQVPMQGAQMGADNSMMMHLCQEHFPEPIMMMSRDKPLCKKCIAEQFTAVKKGSQGSSGPTVGDSKVASA